MHVLILKGLKSIPTIVNKSVILLNECTRESFLSNLLGTEEAGIREFPGEMSTTG